MATAGATNKRPTHDMTLSDGVTTIGLMLADARGKDAPTAIRRTAYPRQSTKISNTNNKYSDLEPPYYQVLQDDWTGGRGSATFEDDTTRFMDSHRAWTDQLHQIILGGQETYSSTPRNCSQSLPGDMNWQSFDTDYMLAHSFTVPAAGYTVSGAMVWVKYTGTPDNLVVEIWDDSTGDPGSIHDAGLTSTLGYSAIEPTVSQLRYFPFNSTHALAAGTYWLVVRSANKGTTWSIGVNPDAITGTKHSSGGAWHANTTEMYYRVLDNSSYTFKFFEYKRGLYAAVMNMPAVSGHLHLYLNGDRGAADSNAADKTNLNDATKSWTSDEWIGSVVLITKGTGSQESQPWRVITDNDATSLQVSPDWEITHDTTTEYIILGSNKWTEYASLTTDAALIDLAVADDLVYFARDAANIIRYNERNVGGVWTTSSDTETSARAERIVAVNHGGDYYLWGGVSNDSKHKTAVWKANVPKSWSTACDLYTVVSKIVDLNTVWDEQTVTNVTPSVSDDDVKITVAAGFTTGTLATRAIPATDFTRAKKIGMMVKSDVAASSGDLKFIYDDTQFCLHHYLPDNLWKYDVEVLPSKLNHFKSVGRPTYVYWYDSSGTKWYQLYNARDGSTSNYSDLTLDTSDLLYICYDQPMTQIAIDLGTAVNNNTSTLVAKVYDGQAWTAVTTLSDGTASGGATLATDGTGGVISWAAATLNYWNVGSTVDEDDYIPADNYALQLSVTGTLPLDIVNINEITCYGNGTTEFPEAERWHDMTNAYEDSENVYMYGHTFYGKDHIYVGYSKPFSRIKFVMGDTVNTVDSVMAAEFWNGQIWSSLSITDGTRDVATTKKTLAKTGDMTFTIPDTWQKGCYPWESSVLGNDIFLVKLTVGTTTTSSVDINKVTLEDDTLIETFRYIPLTRAKDGDTGTHEFVTLSSDDYIYVMFDEKFNKVIFDFATANTADASLTGEYFDGSIWKTISTSYSDGTKSGDHCLGTDGEVSFAIPYDWAKVSIENQEGYAVRLKSDADTTQMKIVDVEVGNDNKLSKDFPALTAGQWHWVEISITPDTQNPDETKIISIGLSLATDLGAQNIYLHGGLYLLGDTPEFISIGGAEENIVSLEAYGDERANPWVFTDAGIWEIQTQNNNSPVPIPLKELRNLRSETNGQASTTSNVYLVFNLGQHIQKYYQHNMDDIGPDRDEGLPDNRKGYPIALLSYPSRIIAAIDSGDIPVSGLSPTYKSYYSSVLVRRESGWHEMYRAPNGMRMHDICMQMVPGKIDRLWITHGSDILWIPMPNTSFNPLNDLNFRYTHEAEVITGWFTLGFLDVSKFFKSLKLYSESLSGTSQYVGADYQTETGTLISGWTAISDDFDTSPFQEVLLSSSYNITGRRIRFRFRLYTDDNTKTPIVRATVLDALMRFPVKYTYACNVRLSDHPVGYGNRLDMLTDVEDVTAQLETWSDAPTVLTWRCLYSPFDNKRVVLEPPGMRPIEMSAESQREVHLGEIVLMEV